MGDLNIYFYVAMFLLTLNAVLYTHSIIKNKDEGWKWELFGGIFVYMLFSVLMIKMTIY